MECARNKVEEALRCGPDPILVSGPTGHGKTLLLRSLRTNAPSGFVPLLVPFSNVEPQEIARWIVAPTLSSIGDPVLELTSLLQANVRSGGKTLLLMDEVQSTPPATLAKLFELLTESDVAVSVVLAGLPGEALDQVLGAAPPSIQKIEVAQPWSRVDAELLLTHVALTLGIPATELIAAIDVDEVLRASAGNPRLVRAALGRQLRFAKPARVSIPPVAVASLLPSAPRARISTPPDPPTPIPFVDCAPAGRASSIEPDEASPASPPQRSRPAIALRRLLHGMERFDRAAHHVQVVLVRGACAIRSHGHRLGSATRARVRDGYAQLRSRSLLGATFIQNTLDVWTRQLKRAIAIASPRAAVAGRMERARSWIMDVRQRTKQACLSMLIRCRRGMTLTAIDTRTWLSRLRSRTYAHCVALWNGVRARVGYLQSAIVVAGLLLSRRTREILMVAQRLLRQGDRIPRFGVHYGLVMAGIFVALGASVAIGRIPIRSFMALSSHWGATGVEPILFRLNSHPWAIVEVDGVKAGSTPLTISLEPGSHRFRVVMADGQIHEDVLVVSKLLDHYAFRWPFAPGPEAPRNHFASASP